MSENKHTPGPWIISNIPTGLGTFIVETEKNQICRTINKGQPIISTDQEHANAKLIAAAPDLLEALQNIRGIEAHISDSETKMFFQKTVYPAIKKATE